MRRALLAFCAAALLSTPSLVSAKPSKELTQELQGYAADLKEVTDPHARQALLMLRGLIADKADIKELQALKADEDPRVRLGAGLALLLAKDKGAEAFVIEQLVTQDAYLAMRDTVSLLDDKVELALVRAIFKAKKPELVKPTLRYLATLEGEHLKLAIGALDDKDDATRRLAIEALLAARNPALISAVPTMLKHKDEQVQLAGVDLAAQLLQMTPALKAEALAALEPALNTKSTLLTARVAAELTRQHHSAGFAKLLQLAAAEEGPTRAERLETAVLHARASGLKPDKALISGLIPKTKDQRELVALYRLGMLAGDLELLGKVIEMYGSNTYDERLLAVQAMGDASSDQVVALLSRSLFEGNPVMRLQAARGLGLQGNVSSLDALQRAASGERDAQVKEEVIIALGRVKSPRSLSVLRLHTSGTPPIKRAVIESIRALQDPQGFQALEPLLRDRDREIQWRAFLAATTLDAKRAQPYLNGAMRDAPDLFPADIEQLPAQSRAALFTAALKHESDRVQTATVAHLLNFRARPEYAGLLRDALSNTAMRESVRRNILAQLADRPTSDDRLIFEQLVRDKINKNLARAATASLVRHPTSDLEATLRGAMTTTDSGVKAIAAYGIALLHQ